MSPDSALALIAQLIETAMFVAGPILAASLAAGIIVGIMQTATQVNEASISYIVKVMAVVGVLAAVGPALADHLVNYTRTSIQSIETIVH